MKPLDVTGVVVGAVGLESGGSCCCCCAGGAVLAGSKAVGAVVGSGGAVLAGSKAAVAAAEDAPGARSRPGLAVRCCHGGRCADCPPRRIFGGQLWVLPVLKHYQSQTIRTNPMSLFLINTDFNMHE